jgi:hypothetical protein
MNKFTTLLSAVALLGMSASSHASPLNTELMADVSKLLVSSIQESIQKMSVEAKANLQNAVKKQLEETAEQTVTQTPPNNENKEEK